MREEISETGDGCVESFEAPTELVDDKGPIAPYEEIIEKSSPNIEVEEEPEDFIANNETLKIFLSLETLLDLPEQPQQDGWGRSAVQGPAHSQGSQNQTQAP